MRRRNRLLNPNRNKRDANTDFNYDYDSNLDNIKVFPQSEYGMRNVPGNKFGYSRRKYRRYLHRNGYLRSPFFSSSDNDNAIVVDDTTSPIHNDILGLKKYREKNRKKVAEKDFGGGKLYKRSAYLFNNPSRFKNNVYDLSADLMPGMQDGMLQQTGPLGNFSQNTGPYANIINTAVLGVNVRSNAKNNTEPQKSGDPVDPNGKPDCEVVLPLTSHFEGLRFPNVQGILTNMSKSEAATEKSQNLTTEALIVAKSVDSNPEEITTEHVNSLYDVTHPTSAIEQRILGASDDTFAVENIEVVLTSTAFSANAEDQNGDYLNFDNRDHKEQEQHHVIAKSHLKNGFRTKGAKPNNNIEDSNKTKQISLDGNQKGIDGDISYDDSEIDQEYNYEEQNNLDKRYEMLDDEDMDIKKKRQQPAFYLRGRHLLTTETEDCKETNKTCSAKKKRSLPDFFGMSNEEDYKDDDIYGKQLLKKSSSEGEDDDAGGDPFIGKKLQFQTKKKENEPFDSKNLHVVGIPEKYSSSDVPVQTPVKLKHRMHTYPVKIRVARSRDEIDDQNFNLCGTGKNKIYCDMKDEREDDIYLSNNTQVNNDNFKKQYAAILKSPNNEKKQNDMNYLFVPFNGSAAEQLNLNKKGIAKPIKIVQISEIVNPPENAEHKESSADKPYKEGATDDYDQQIAKHLYPKTVSKTFQSEGMIVMPRGVHENENSLEMREESNQDIIEAGFKRKPVAKNDVRQKRKNRIRNYLERLRLNNNRKNLQHRMHKPPKFDENIPQPPKYQISFLEPSNVFVRKPRSFQQPQNLVYPNAKANKRNQPEGDASVTTESTSAPAPPPSTEQATEIYAQVSKSPLEYIEYQKEKPVLNHN